MTSAVTQKAVNAWCWAGLEEKVVEVRIASSSSCDLARAHGQKSDLGHLGAYRGRGGVPRGKRRGKTKEQDAAIEIDAF